MTIVMRRSVVAVLAVLTTVGVLAMSGCGVFGGSVMNSEKAREQLITAVEAVQSATGTNWDVDAEPGLLGCSKTHSQWHTSWNATPTDEPDTSFMAVRKALEEVGFTTSINGADTSTPVLLAQTGEGFGLGFSIPAETGRIRFTVSSDCFLEEE